MQSSCWKLVGRVHHLVFSKYMLATFADCHFENTPSTRAHPCTAAAVRSIISLCLDVAGSLGVTGPVLHAFAAWLRLSAGAGLDGAALANHPLTKAAMEGLTSVDTFEDASNAVCELVMCTSTRGEPEQQMMPLVQLLVPAVSFPSINLVMLSQSTV